MTKDLDFSRFPWSEGVDLDEEPTRFLRGPSAGEVERWLLLPTALATWKVVHERYEDEPAGFRELTGIMLEIADIAGEGRLVSVLEGGYNPPGLASAVAAHVDELRIGFSP